MFIQPTDRRCQIRRGVPLRICAASGRKVLSGFHKMKVDDDRTARSVTAFSLHEAVRPAHFDCGGSNGLPKSQRHDYLALVFQLFRLANQQLR